MRFPNRVFLMSALLLTGRAFANAPASMTLEQAIAQALANHPSVASAAAGSRSAEGAAISAKSGLLPSVQASVSKSRMQDETPLFEGSSTSVSASQLLYDLGRTPQSIAAAQSQLRAARANEDDTRLQVVRSVTAAYFGLLKAQGVAAASAETLTSRQYDRDAAQARLDNGSAARFDVLRAATALAQSRQALVAAQADVRSAQVALNSAIGRVGTEEITTVEPAPAPEQTEKDPVAYALANRPDVVVARLGVDAARHSLSATRVGNAPTLSAAGQLGGAAKTFPADTLRWSAGITLSWNVFDGFRNSGAIRSAQGSLQRAEADLRATELTATQQVTNAVIAVETGQEQVKLGEATLQQASEARDVAVGRYQAGAGTQLEVSDAESQLHSARVDLVNARYSLAQAQRELNYLMGKFGPGEAR
ncbi:MAG TPA: TolC family protein [Armatimonadota bacterium]